MKLFATKERNLEEIRQGLTEIGVKRTAKQAERANVDAELAKLEGERRDVLVAAVLDESSAAVSQRGALERKINEARARKDAIDDELIAYDAAESVLNSQKTAAVLRERKGRWDSLHQQFIPYARRIEELIAQFGAEMNEASPIIEELGHMAWGSVTTNPLSAWRDSVNAFMARKCDGAKMAGLPRTVDHHLARNEFFLEKHMEDNLRLSRDQLLAKLEKEDHSE